MKKLLVLGIGAGDPDHLTLQAVKALGRTDVFFILDKGSESRDLVRARQDVIDRHARGLYRVVTIPDPVRERSGTGYTEAVENWRRRRADIVEGLLRDELEADETGALLVWGDPCLYDGALAVVDDVVRRGAVPLEYEVVPGISSVSALAARHRVALNRVAGPVQITTGRRLREGLPETADDVVVMLDAHDSFTALPDPAAYDIFWGAYLGTPDELLVSGRVSDVAEEIRERRAAARERKGWIMDTYLLRRVSPTAPLRHDTP